MNARYVSAWSHDRISQYLLQWRWGSGLSLALVCSKINWCVSFDFLVVVSVIFVGFMLFGLLLIIFTSCVLHTMSRSTEDFLAYLVVCFYTCIHIHILTHTHTHTHMHTYTHTHIHIHIRVCVCVYVYVYVYVCVCRAKKLIRGLQLAFGAIIVLMLYACITL